MHRHDRVPIGVPNREERLVTRCGLHLRPVDADQQDRVAPLQRDVGWRRLRRVESSLGAAPPLTEGRFATAIVAAAGPRAGERDAGTSPATLSLSVVICGLRKWSDCVPTCHRWYACPVTNVNSWNLGRRTFLAGLAPITITGAARGRGSVNQDAGRCALRYLHGPGRRRTRLPA